MDTGLRLYIYSNKDLVSYLKMHSYLYKQLIRNPESIKKIEDNMKKENHTTVEDKLNKVSSSIKLAETILDTLK